MNMTFGKNLKAQRIKQNLSAELLASKCGVSRSYITLIENGLRLPGKKIIPKLASALEITDQEIIEWYLEDVRRKLEWN